MSSTATLSLAEAQLGIWLGQQKLPEAAIYNTAEYLVLPLALDEERMLDAIGKSIRESDSLCCRFPSHAGNPGQVVDTAHELKIKSFDLSDLNAAEAHAEAERWMMNRLDQRIDLEREQPYVIALFRIEPKLFYFYIQIHHIAIDGFGYTLFYQRVAQHYNQDVQALGSQAFPRLHEYIKEDREYQESKYRDTDQGFWKDYLQDLDPVRSLNGATARSFGSTVGLKKTLSPKLFQRLVRLASEQKAQWIDVLLASVFVFWQQKTGQRDIALAFPVMNRMGSRTLRIPCMKMNIIPLRLRLKEGDSFARVLAGSQEQMKRTRPFQRFRYEHMKQNRVQRGESARIFSAVVNIMPFANRPQFSGVEAAVKRLRAGPVEDISFSFVPTQDSLEISLEANAETYDLAALTQYLAEFHEQLNRCLQDPHEALLQGVADKSILAGKDFKQPEYQDVLLSFQNRVENQPDSMALRGGNGELSYAALGRKVDLLARKMAGKGRVALALRRSEAAILSIWACIRAGIVYTIIDPDGPALRNQKILADFSPNFILTADALPELLAAKESALKPIDAYDPNQPAYVLYTSGSTGQPKGVIIPRRGLASFVHFSNRVYQVGPQDRVLQFAPLHFDASVEEIFVSHCHGACLVLRNEDCLQSFTQFLLYCETQAITLLDLPTAYWHELVGYLAGKGQSLPRLIHTVIIGGERVQQALVDQWHRLQGPAVRLFNTYGPTETTVVASTALARMGQDLSIGQPLDHLCFHVMDDRGQAVRQGETGELWIAGDSVGLGYWNRSDPVFLAVEGVPCYRTGDLVRLDPGGRIEFLGRRDQELKISGHRISPEEIEGVTSAHPGIAQVAVVASIKGQQKLLAAFYVGREPLAADDLRTFLQARLPEVMIPRLFIELPDLPKNSSGKIDRKALMQNLQERLENVEQSPAFADADVFDLKLKSIIEDVLQVPLESADQDLFAAGGQSLQMIQLAARLTSAFHIDITVAAAFSNSTLRAMSNHIRGTKAVDSLQTLIEADIQDDVLQQKIKAVERSSVGREKILLTGATGFLGRYILADLLYQKQRDIVCLIRADHDAHAWQRLAASFAEMSDLAGLRILENNRHRLQVWAADLNKPRFGLDEERYQLLTSQVTGILHNAAEVSVTRSYASLKASNVEATRQLLHCAAEERLKSFTYVSTLATAEISADGIVTERFSDFHGGLQDGYQQSKWASEQLVKLARAAGMSAKALRLGRITGSPASAYVNAKDLVWQIIAACCRLNRYPNLSFQEPWTPVDYTARIIVSMHEAPALAQSVFHILPRSLISIAQLFTWLEDLELCQKGIPLHDWLNDLKDRGGPEDLGLLSFFESRRSAQGPSERVTYDQTQLLAELKMSEQDTPQLEYELFVHYLLYAQKNGLIPAKHVKDRLHE